MKKIVFSLGVIFMMFSCSKDGLQKDEFQQQKQLSKAEINAVIDNQLQNTGDFIWQNTDANTIWSALNLGEGILTVGYGNNQNDFEKNVSSNEIKQEIFNIVLENEKQSKIKDILVEDDDYINVISLKVNNYKTVNALLKNKNIRYIEPSFYEYTNDDATNRSSSGSSGCGYDAVTLSSADYRTVAPGSKVPWSFDVHQIPKAWSYSTGRGVTIGIIDTGLSPQQSLLNQNFNDGYSTGRYVQKYGTYVDSWWWWSTSTDGVDDRCGHGTSMASVATAPRNNNYLPVGVAYNSNLVTYRAVKNVVINTYHEEKGVQKALIALANRRDVKIISMSLGSPWSIGRIRDAVRYAYNRGKLIFAAGGTSTSFTNWYGVIFPANMSETVAVTGIKESGYTRCDVCHSGSQIDFTVTMQRTGSNNTVPVLSYYDGASDYVGGSSVATATTAGIAALVWSKHPSWNRTQVLNKLKQSAHFYPNRDSQFGYGNINALLAVQ